VEVTASEIGHFHTFQTSATLTLDRAYCRVSLIDLYLHTKFHSNRKIFFWMDGRADIETGFITSTQRSRFYINWEELTY